MMKLGLIQQKQQLDILGEETQWQEKINQWLTLNENHS
jgi:hypothetical protein